ncbi:MAG: Hint domain-containing protein [Pseudoruegeria sp.]
MATNSFFVYNTGGLNFSGGTVTLSNTFDAVDDRWVVEITDDDNLLDGDYSNNENGYDTNQTGSMFAPDGTTQINLGSGANNGEPIYAEQQYNLTGSDGSTITILELEIDGVFAGYLPTAPLDPAISYSYTITNVINDNEGRGFFWNNVVVNVDTYKPEEYENADGSPNILGAVLCFTAETIVTTPLGHKRLGDIQQGEKIKTKDNGFQPVRWVHRRRLTQSELLERPDLCPIVIEQDAFALGQPCRQTRLSPQHRVFFKSPMNEFFFGTQETLAPAKGLLNGTTVWQDIDCNGIEYVHVLFDRHEILKADGLFSESFHPGDWSVAGLTEPARDELYAIFPELADTPSEYGPSAYPSLSVKEANLLIA